MKNVLTSFFLLSVFSFNTYAVEVNCATGNNQTVFDDAGMNCFENNTAANAEQVNANFKVLLDSISPTGIVAPFAGPDTAVPTGWLYCDGSAVSRTTYDELFAVIGISHGSGDGSTTFNLPDYRGRFLRGVDDGAGRDPDAGSRTAVNSGGNTGDAVGSVQEDNFKSHKHKVTRGVKNGGSYRISNYASYDNGDVNTTSTGGSETRPKNVNVNWIIKY